MQHTFNSYQSPPIPEPQVDTDDEVEQDWAQEQAQLDDPDDEVDQDRDTKNKFDLESYRDAEDAIEVDYVTDT